MKTPDRFEQMIEQEYQRWLNGGMAERGWLVVAKKCLARQHAAYVRMVKAMPCAISGKATCPSPDWPTCAVNKNDLLAWLTKMAR